MSISRPFRLLLFGPAGSGKGTVAKKILKDFDFHYLCCGDQLRTEIRDETALGKKVKDLVQNGKLVPDELVTELMVKELKKLRDDKNILLDGYPRTKEQAQSLDAVAAPHLVFELDVPLEEILRRLAQRYIHPASGRIYNLEYNPPKKPGIDDLSGEPLIRRVDDEADTIRKRWENYAKTEALVCVHYAKLNRLIRIGGKTSDEIYGKLKPMLAERLNNRKILDAQTKTKT